VVLAVIQEPAVKACSHVSEYASVLAGSGGEGGSGVDRQEDDSYISDQLYHGESDKKDDEEVVTMVGQGIAWSEVWEVSCNFVWETLTKFEHAARPQASWLGPDDQLHPFFTSIFQLSDHNWIC
jgi:hypothetical protein